MIKKCDHTGCTKAGTCRAPKTRELKEFWYFCREHAAEYNKNWNYYAGMSPAEIEAEWERETFGTASTDAKRDNGEYAAFINDFLSGRTSIPPRRRTTTPAPVTDALKTFELPPTASWRDVSARYRMLAKKYHPDTATGNAKKFTTISAAYDVLKKYFKK